MGGGGIHGVKFILREDDPKISQASSSQKWEIEVCACLGFQKKCARRGPKGTICPHKDCYLKRGESSSEMALLFKKVGA